MNWHYDLRTRYESAVVGKRIVGLNRLENTRFIISTECWGELTHISSTRQGLLQGGRYHRPGWLNLEGGRL